ncbi:hypothetical protein F5I97DRAFT_1939148 [Phlebopus sp. FC_14]|nr:hypothetical protein F5I97DRAFT_1939148 [Phlebopus sp. FC_14]
MTKRMHALLELLTSECAYASDLALIRDIHIPLALGQPAPFHANGTPSPPPFSPGSGSSSRTVSTASDSSTSSSQLGPPMSRDDVRIIFGNISDLALFSDKFVERLEDALGGVLEGGSGEDRVGALFLEIIPALEPPYKTYITRHPTALAHLNALPSSPALSAYLAHTRTLASSLTHAWDLPSLLIKPVQRLLKYSLLLGAIIDATPDSHEDRVALIKAREKMEEVARSVNEDRRRWEVVREVLGGAPLPNANGTTKPKKGTSVNVGVSATASAHLNRMRSLRAPKLRDLAESEPDSAEAAEVARLEIELQRHAAFLDKLAKDAMDWRNTMHVALVALRQWGITFGAVLGLTPSPSALNPDLLPDSPSQQAIDTADPEVRSEAYDAFTLLLSTLPRLSKTLESNLQSTFIPVLCDLKAMLEPPMKLFSAMHALAPLHNALLHTHFAASKSRRPAPALLTASQSYLALRSALAAELPTLFSAMNRATGYAIRMLAREQATFYLAVNERWADLWDALRVEGERCGGSDETLRVWWERWSAVEDRLKGMRIIKKEKWWAEREKELRDGAREVRGDTRDREKDGVRERDGTHKPSRRSTAPTSGPSTPAANVIATLAALDPAHASTSPPSKRQHHQSHQSHPSHDTIGSNRRRSGSTSTMPAPTQIHRRPSNESLRSGKSGKISINGGKSSRSSRGDDEPPVPRLKPNFTFPNGSGGPQRVKSTPAISPLRTSASTSSSHVLVDIETAYPSSPVSYATFDDEERDRDGRGRTQRRSSFKSKLADSFRPSHHRRRSSSVKSLGAPSAAPSYHSTDVPLPPYSPSSSAHFTQSQHALHPSSTASSHPQNPRPRPSPTLATTRALYTTRVIHACLPPAGVSYRGLPFFTLERGETFDVLREYGHPSTHADLPLYVDDGEDCLLLVRTRGKGGGQGVQEGDVGWALASFLLPLD